MLGPAGHQLEPWRLRCVNLPNGSELLSSGLRVDQGHVQPLWMGLEVPLDAAAGVYRGHVTVRDMVGGGAERVGVEVSVLAEVVEQHGDLELWRHSRLRWLVRARPSIHLWPLNSLLRPTTRPAPSLFFTLCSSLLLPRPTGLNGWHRGCDELCIAWRRAPKPS